MASQTFAGGAEYSLDSVPPRQTAEGAEEANWCGTAAAAAQGARTFCCELKQWRPRTLEPAVARGTWDVCNLGEP